MFEPVQSHHRQSLGDVRGTRKLPMNCFYGIIGDFGGKRPPCVGLAFNLDYLGIDQQGSISCHGGDVRVAFIGDFFGEGLVTPSIDAQVDINAVIPGWQTSRAFIVHVERQAR